MILDYILEGWMACYAPWRISDCRFMGYIGGGGGIEPHTRVVAQGVTPYCDQIVTVFLRQLAVIRINLLGRFYPETLPIGDQHEEILDDELLSSWELPHRDHHKLAPAIRRLCQFLP